MDSESRPEEYTLNHKDGSIMAKGRVVNGLPVGYWQWFRKNGTLMRSGYFRDGIQVGEWTTYDKEGNVYKVTDMKDGKIGAEKTIIRRNE
ncbi:MAG: hypothetical protein JXA25_04185 [Anaerolineales bacterium]|nr:hypothetical protein [Anaerolineales bacterium]